MSAPKMMPALMGGLFIGILSSLPYIKGGNICCCLWVVSGGILAALLMQQNTARPITVGEGAVVGLLAGLVGTVVLITWGVVGLALFSHSPFDMADFQRAMSEGRDVPPEAREALENLSPAVILVVGGVIWLVVSLVFATVGGVLGALLFRRKGGPDVGVPSPSGPAPFGPGGQTPTFTPPTFTPPAPVVPPPPPSPPPAPPVDVAPPFAAAPPVPGLPPIGPPPPAAWSESPEDIGDAATIMIPAAKLGLPPKPSPAAAPGPPPVPGPIPSADREPDSH